MRKKILLGLLFIVIVIYIFTKSPVASSYNYTKAKSLYDSNKYEKSIPYFEHSLYANSNNKLAKYYYVQALSKLKPTYSVQFKLAEIANSKENDETTKLAKMKVSQIRKDLLKNFQDNYINNAVDGLDVVRWDIKSFPLKVYFDNAQDVPDYYKQGIQYALNYWSSKTNFIKFKEVTDKNQANIVVSFNDITTTDCGGENCHYSVAETKPEVRGNILKKMNLKFYKTNLKHENFSRREILNTALHEIGHTLGIMGHSDNPYDIMYASKNNDSYTQVFYKDLSISKSDINTIILLYKLKPTVSNVANLESEKFYCPQVILGTDDEVLQRKLKEYEQYVKNYPRISGGYINLASVYMDMGDFDKASTLLEKAKQYSTTSDENYMIYYNLAILNYNTQNYKEALDFANQAKSYNDTEEIEEFITEVSTRKK